MRHMLTALAATAATILGAAAADAQVLYNVQGSFEADTDNDQVNETYAFTFSYTAPTFITSLTQAAPSSCTITGTFYRCGATSRFDPGSTTIGPPLTDDFFEFAVDNVDMTGGRTSNYFFQGGAFGAVGVYSDAGHPDPNGPIMGDGGPYFVGNAGPATLTVSLARPTGAVPEPASWALLILGFGGAGAALRRRRSADAIVTTMRLEGTN